MTAESWTALAAFFALNFAAASSGAVFRPGAWYETLRKPSWTPPNWAFPVVWTALFCANAVAGWLVWETAGSAAWPALALYTFSLLLNAAWSALFFGIKRMDWALIEVAFLWASIAAVMVAFAPINGWATALIAPYLVWVTIAAQLNRRMMQLNAPVGASRAAAAE